MGLAIAFAGGVLVGWLIPRPEPLGPLVVPAGADHTATTPPASGSAPPLAPPRTAPPSPAPTRAAGRTWATTRPPAAAGSQEAPPSEAAPSPSEQHAAPSDAADWPVRVWPTRSPAQEERTLDAVDDAEEAAGALDACDGVEVQSVDCSAPPCMVFFSAPGATCLALSSWEHHAPGCPSPLGGDGGGLVLAAPIVCPDGYRECVRALVAADPKQIEGFEDAEGSDSDRELEILFSVGHRLTRSAPAWACKED